VTQALPARSWEEVDEDTESGIRANDTSLVNLDAKVCETKRYSRWRIYITFHHSHLFFPTSSLELIFVSALLESPNYDFSEYILILAVKPNIQLPVFVLFVKFPKNNRIPPQE
jgi:hypothetical protein